MRIRKIFLLFVITLLLAGCSGQKEQQITESQDVETAGVEENKDTEIVDTEDLVTVEMESEEQNKPTEPEESKQEPQAVTEAEKPVQNEERSKPEETAPPQEAQTETETSESTETPKQESTNPEQPKEETVETPTKPETAAYNPNEVVSLATAKTKAYGKISIPEDLDQMLANGEITQEEHDEYYPYDGAGYYSVFVETDLNQAATTSGRKLGSVDGIASYIAEMLSLETGPYFYIEYAGIHSINGTDFYEFRCYRA